MKYRKSVFIAALVVVVIAVLGFRFLGVQDPMPNSAEPTPEEPSGSDEVRSEQSGMLEIPGRVTLEPTTFPAAGAHQKYLVELSIHAEKPEDSPGRATYFGYNLICRLGNGDSRTISVGGTQNLVNGKAVTVGATALLPGADDSEYSCHALVANEYDGIASTGSKVPFTAVWTVTPVLEASEWVNVDEKLPAVVEPGETFDLYSGQIPIQGGSQEQLTVIVNAHSTTCTTVSGSREDGHAWCDEETLDDEGSEAELLVGLERAGDSTSCSSEVRHAAQIDGLVHHYVASVVHELATDPRCDGAVRLRVSVRNEGPAPLVLHRQNTEILIVQQG